MNEIEKVITIFRKRRDVNSDKTYESLLAHSIDPDSVQTIYQNESPALFTFFGVHKTPTVLCFADGEETKRLIGNDEINTNTLIKFLNE